MAHRSEQSRCNSASGLLESAKASLFASRNCFGVLATEPSTQNPFHLRGLFSLAFTTLPRSDSRSWSGTAPATSSSAHPRPWWIIRRAVYMRRQATRVGAYLARNMTVQLLAFYLVALQHWSSRCLKKQYFPYSRNPILRQTSWP